MFKVVEFLDIEKIEDIRKRILNKELDEHDNFSFHAALIENGIIYGVARLHRYNDNIVIDNIAVEKFSKSVHYEMLFKALLNKSQNLGCNYVIANLEREINFYFQFGFSEDLKVKPKDIIFKCKNMEDK